MVMLRFSSAVTQRGHVALGERLDVGEHLGEPGIQRVDHLPLTDVTRAQQIAGAAVEDQWRGQSERAGEVELRVAVDLGLLAGCDVDADQSRAVGVAVRADPDAAAVRGHLDGPDSDRVIGAVV